MHQQEILQSTMIRGATRGLIASMAMTGTRTVTSALSPHQKSPPQAIVDEHAPEWVRHLSRRQRQALTEIAHWIHGSGGGAVFGLLPGRVRGHPLSGPVYGLVVWLAYELALGPILDIEHARHRHTAWRAAIAIDHVLYGVIVAGQLAQEPARTIPARQGILDRLTARR